LDLRIWRGFKGERETLITRFGDLLNEVVNSSRLRGG